MRIPHLHLYLFGHLRLTLDGQPFPFHALPKVTPLLAYLLLNRAAPTPRDALAFTLWPDVPEARAKANLRRHLHDLRRALPPHPADLPWLRVTPQTLHWNPAAPYWLDVAAFEFLEQQPHRLADAVALAAAPLLPDVDEPWLFLERERLQRQTTRALQSLIRRHAAAADYPQAAAYADQALAADPLHEPLLRQLLALLAAGGQRTTAVSRYHAFAQQLAAELDLPPAPETTALFTAITANRPAADLLQRAGLADAPAPASTSADPPLSLPAPVAPLIGRDAAVAELAARLTADPPARLLTLTGPVGIGKTRLAIAVAHHLRPHAAAAFPDGIFFVPLAHLEDAADVPAAVAAALGVRPGRGGSVAEPLLNALRYRRLLLLLDNLEHLPGAADHLASWLRSAPGLSLLVTSQHRARLQGEQSVVVPPLALPTADTPPERLPDFAAVALFLAVARRTLGETAVPPHTATHVAHICRLLDGNPLAIELAAARSHLVPPDVMLAQLRRHTHLLETRAADVPARHRSLQAAIQWSVDLLDAAARQLFVRLALFPHGFSPAAVTAVLLDRPVTHPTDVDPETLNRLEDLFDKHLIVAADDNRLEGELRFTMLTTLHGFAHALLAADPALPDLQAAYVRYYAWLTQETSRVARGRSTAQGYSLDRIRIEEPNILAALHWAVGPGQDGRLSPHAEPMLRCLQLLWRARLRYAETVTWVQRTLAFEAQLTPHARATLLSLVSYAAAMQADYANAVAYVEDAYALARQLEDGPLLAAILSNYGTILSHAGDNDRAVALLQEALSLEDSLDTERRGVLQHNLAVAQLARGRFAEGIGPAQEAIGHYQATGQDTNAQDGAMLLADLYLMNGQHAAAAALLRESFAAAQAVGNQNALLSGLSTVADHLFRLGEQAAKFNAASLRLHSASHSLTQQAGFRWPQYYERIFAETLSTLRTRLGHEAFVTAWTEGTRLTMPEAIPFALTALAATRPPLP